MALPSSATVTNHITPTSAQGLRDGFVCLDKPAGLSSAQIVAVAKRALHGLKIGHLGTLDPFATGLLVCAVGRATRLARYLSAGCKQYEGTFAIGVKTSTDDLTGEVLSRSVSIPTEMEVQKAVRQCTGALEQVPPRVSAVHVDGTRAYRMARRGEEFTLAARPVRVELLAIAQVEPALFSFRISCSGGFYVRAWARDIGEVLGCGAALSTLRRTVSEPFTLSDAISPSEVSDAKLIPWHAPFEGLESVDANFAELCALARGDQRTVTQLAARTAAAEMALYRYEHRPCGILVRTAGKWSLGLHMQGGELCHR